jgi:AcrR family transcriptional regulator
VSPPALKTSPASVSSSSESVASAAPISRNPAKTRSAILAAATGEFAQYGLGGARIDRIAARSGSNKRLIYYYFGNKDALFLAVLEEAYASIRRAEQALHLDELDPLLAIRALIEFTWEYYIAHPEFLTLLNSENLHRAAHLKTLPRIRELNSPLVQMIDAVLERGRREGVFRAGVDPVQLYISIAALAYFYLSNSATLSTIFGRDLMSRKAKAERLAHMTALVHGYLML